MKKRKILLSDFNDQMCERINSLCWPYHTSLLSDLISIDTTGCVHSWQREKKWKSMNILSTFELSSAYLTFLPPSISPSFYCWKISNLLFFRRSLSFTSCWLFAFQLIFFLNTFIDRHLFVDSVDNDDQHQRRIYSFSPFSLLLHISQMF